ncbi:hypothetical protein B0H14DRAFT_3460252 [Mycena olivaceomarginata]|nr:hypothetical protein B0H14DRAFT_3460252 [Mycena olivaceomarginata]
MPANIIIYQAAGSVSVHSTKVVLESHPSYAGSTRRHAHHHRSRHHCTLRHRRHPARHWIYSTRRRCPSRANPPRDGGVDDPLVPSHVLCIYPIKTWKISWIPAPAVVHIQCHTKRLDLAPKFTATLAEVESTDFFAGRRWFCLTSQGYHRRCYTTLP